MRGNKQGPENQGPRTGRGLGYCGGSNRPGFESNEPPMGMRRGGGYGYEGRRGYGRNMARRMGRGAGPGFGRGFYDEQADSAVQKEILDRLDKLESLLAKAKKDES